MVQIHVKELILTLSELNINVSHMTLNGIAEYCMGNSLFCAIYIGLVINPLIY